MKLEGESLIAADRRTVWEMLNDPEILKACIPGCQSLEGSPEEGLEAVVTQKIGPVKATFRGRVEITDVVPAESYRLVGEGKGGVAGFAKGAADVHLEDTEDGGTRLTWQADVQIGGKLAQLGSRLIGGTVRKLSQQFFDCLQQKIEERTTA